MYIGCHLSTANGFTGMGNEINALGGNTFAFFTRNPRGGAAKAIEENDVNEYLSIKKKTGIGQLVAHAPYTMNLCSAAEETRNNGLAMLADDMKRMEFVKGNYYNFHPGSHGGQGVEAGVNQIASALNQVLSGEQNTIVLLETMAGKGKEVGRSFEELKLIIDQVEHNELLGICFDTCHVWDAGYDIVNDLDGVLTEFDKILGLERLKAVHFNDSMNEKGSRKDRHQKIGEGMIGLEALKRVALHPVFQDKPFILETPNDAVGYADEIAMIKGWL